MNDLIIFYGVPNDKEIGYKYAKYDGTGYTLFWYNKETDEEIIFPLDNEDLDQLR